MGRRPLIGITCNFDYRDAVGMVSDMGVPGQAWNFLAGDYVDMITKAVGTAVLIPQLPHPAKEALEEILSRLDGVLISGGHDVGPVAYGEAVRACSGVVMPMRDEQDLLVARYCMERKLPLLGVCRGCQILNVAAGGTLWQDVVKDGEYESHSCGGRYPRNYGWHTVAFTPGSRMAEIFGAEEIRVNSYHHQAVKEAGEGVAVTGRAFDGVPEAIEVSGHPFALAVQWHPEMMFDSGEQLRLAEAFVDACRAYSELIYG